MRGRQGREMVLLGAEFEHFPLAVGRAGRMFMQRSMNTRADACQVWSAAKSTQPAAGC